jgi:hypothetical protein
MPHWMLSTGGAGQLGLISKAAFRCGRLMTKVEEYRNG